jgi:hypothetical protein
MSPSFKLIEVEIPRVRLPLTFLSGPQSHHRLPRNDNALGLSRCDSLTNELVG